MPRNKDQKRRIRARMQKTGERYTAARAALLRRESPRRLKTAAPKKQWPALAGMSNDAVRTKTGRTWPQWVSELDAADAFEMSHRDIASHVGRTYPAVSGWWAQTITVGYERIRGLRDVGQRRGGSYDANKSRTLPVDVATLYRMFKDTRRRRKWLPDGVARVRTSKENRSIRVDWHDGTRVALFFDSKGPNKSTLTVQHGKLATRKDVQSAKAFWHEPPGRPQRSGPLISASPTLPRPECPPGHRG